MTTLYHFTTNTGHVRESPRAEVGDDIIAMIKPLIVRGGGEIHGLHIAMLPGPIKAFELGWIADKPAVRCELERETESQWKLRITILPHALGSSPLQISMLGDAERCVAWAIIEEEEDRS